MGKIKDQAIKQAKENKNNELGIINVYWFPNEDEVRLIEIADNITKSISSYVEPFYFNASLKDGYPAPSAIALIGLDDYRYLKLPDCWGNWDNAIELKLD